MNRKLLVLDSSYSFEAIKDLQLEHSVECRDLGGYFTHVWSVHPFATLVTSDAWTTRFGRPVVFPMNDGHTFIEGKVGRYAILGRFVGVNFLISQIDIFVFLYRLIKMHEISAIRVGSPLYVGLFGWLLSRICKIPLIVRVGGNHDKIFESMRKPIEAKFFRFRSCEKVIERLVFRAADFVVGANQDNLNFALANGARVARSAVVRYGNLIDSRHFQEPRARHGGKVLLEDIGIGDEPFLMYIGRLESVKMPDHPIQLLSILNKTNKALKLIMVGEGTLLNNLVELCAYHGLVDRVFFCGKRDQGWLAKVLPHASVVISPHTGRALTEAGLAAAPIVAYDVDWQTEIIRSGETGEIIPFGDVLSLARSTSRLLEERAYAEKLGHNLRNLLLDIMNPDRLNETERSYYRKLLQ